MYRYLWMELLESIAEKHSTANTTRIHTDKSEPEPEGEEVEEVRGSRGPRAAIHRVIQ